MRLNLEGVDIKLCASEDASSKGWIVRSHVRRLNSEGVDMRLCASEDVGSRRGGL